MMNNYIKTLLLFCILTVSHSVKASHIMGGDISYECVGSDSFLVTLNLFRDCGGSTIGPTMEMDFTSTCGGNFSQVLSRQTTTEVSAMCSSQTSNSTCNGGLLPGLEKHVYTGIVVLSPACNIWSLSWDLCCRNDLITNLTNPNSLDTYLFAKMYSGVSACNNAPQFNADIYPSVCMNKPVNYNFGTIDPDGDSLVYFMSPGFENAIALVPYAGTYTYLQPLPGANAVLDATNGQFTFTPTAVGVFVVAVRVEEYDRNTGVIKGYSIRDIQVTVTNCTNNSPEVASPGIYNYGGDGVQLDSTTIEVCNGDSFSFDFSFSDSDILDSVSVTHNIYQALDSTAVVTFSGANPMVVNVTWVVNMGNNPTRFIQLRASDGQCPYPGINFAAIKIEINESTWAGENQTICAGTDWVNLSVQGGSSFTWTTISGSSIDTIVTSPNFNMTCSHCDNPIVSPQVTTTFVVYSNLVSSCSSVDTITVYVVPDFTLSLPADTALCFPYVANLVASTSNNTLSYSYNWSTGNLGDTLSTLYIAPQSPSTYAVTVTSTQGCQKMETIQVDLINSLPIGAYIQGDTTLCVGESGNLELVLGNQTPQSCGVSTQPCTGLNKSGIIGNDTTLTTGSFFPAPYGRFYWGVKHQILFTAAEMHAMGMVNGGKITAISFDVATVGSANNFNNFEIKLGCTSSNDVLAGWETGLVTVLPAYTHLVTTGWNQHTFTDAYDWDGISNVVIEICYHNTSWNTSETAFTYYTPTSFQSVRYIRADNATVCSLTTTTATSTDRPNIKFNYCSGVDTNAFNYTWSPTASMDSTGILTPIVTPLVTTNYQVIIQDTGGHCADTLFHQVEVISTFDAGFYHQSPYCLNGIPSFFVPKVAGGLFTGSGVDSNGLFSPSTAGIGTWSINYTLTTPALCANDSIILIEVLPLADASFTNLEVCINADSIILQPVTSGGYWSGPGISDSVSGIFRTSGLTLGTYPIVYTVRNPCESTYTGYVKVIETYNFSFSSTIVGICMDELKNLTNLVNLSQGPNQGSGPVRTTWSDVNGYIDSNGVFDATGLAAGNYSVSVTVEGMDGSCGNLKTLTVEVKGIDYPEFLTDNFCINQSSAKLYVSPWLYGTGVTLTQNPLSPLAPNDTLVIAPFGQNGQFSTALRGVGHWEMTLNFTNSDGCIGTIVDTIHVLNPPITDVDFLGTTLVSKAGMGYQYQWLDCNDNMSPIVGATNAMFTPTVQGNYAVEISAGTCSDQSGCFLTWPLGLNETGLNLGIQIYPNPVTEQLNIDLGIHENVSIEILDAKGKTVWTEKSSGKINTIDMRHLSMGIYVVKLTTDSGIQTQRVMKK